MNIDEIIFEIYKDTAVEIKVFRKEISRKYKLSKREITDIYAKINKYQINKYGEQIMTGKLTEFKTKDDYRIMAERIKQSRIERKNCGERQKRRYKEIEK